MAIFDVLENVEQTAKQHPASFFIPSVDERKRQKIGNSVCLHFMLKNPRSGEPSAERMWVKITQVQGIFSPYKGILEDKPAFIDNLKPGDEITFKSCHIAQTVIKKNDPGWIDSAELTAFVSKMCLEKGGEVLFLYREEPDTKEDSGWRMFTGQEPDEYVDDQNNIRAVKVGYMLDKDPSLLEPLKNGFGTAFERESKSKQWGKVADWCPPE